jgi:hypothetical protein
MPRRTAGRRSDGGRMPGSAHQIGRNLTDAVDGILRGKRYLIHDHGRASPKRRLGAIPRVGDGPEVLWVKE